MSDLHIWVNVIGNLMIVVGLPVALIDMGMNGSGHASGWGLAFAALGLLLVSL